MPKLFAANEGTLQSLGLGNTPQTIVVSPEGEILKVWMGAYLEEMQPEVEAFFGLNLPGLTSLAITNSAFQAIFTFRNVSSVYAFN